jgi:hypothetical protein
MIGFFICLNGVFSALASTLGVGASAAGSLMAAREQRKAMRLQMGARMPKVVDAEPTIPRVKRKAKL